MKINEPIITSLLDEDLYKATMGQLVFHDFPEAIVEWEFFNRGKTVFPEGFATELEKQIRFLSDLSLTLKEVQYLDSLPYFRKTYVEWLAGFQMDWNEVTVTQTGGDLKIHVKGRWFRVIFWEVKLMAIISELYFMMTGQIPDQDWDVRMGEKGYLLERSGCEWVDMGTRRRFSSTVHSNLVKTMKGGKGFLGTSNIYLAMKYDVPVCGTSAHEAQMGISAKYGARLSNSIWLKIWSDFYQGQLGIALTDTFTTDVFLKDFGGYNARLYDGVRHDSSDPYVWGDKMLKHYDSLGIDARNKKFVFSDNLNVQKYLNIHAKFYGKCRPIAGIGTNFTNDVGVKPLNMVIKMTKANFGDGWIDVVKLSDEAGKHTGNPDAITQTKRELGINV